VESKRSDETHDFQKEPLEMDNKAAEFTSNELDVADKDVEIFDTNINIIKKGEIPKFGGNRIGSEISPQSNKLEEANVWKRIRVKLLSLICGVESEELLSVEHVELQRQAELERKLQNFRSLTQKTWEKVVLNANLLLILSIAIGLFIFFSIPPQLHIFKNVTYNETILH
jgi:hypothetical protein